MKKIALLIGISEYESGLASLPATLKDIEAMKRILQSSDIGRFDQVTVLTNPALVEMQEQIDMLFRECTREDLVLLYFSGHGIKDEAGALYFTTCQTRKLNDRLSPGTAIPATFVRESMNNSPSRRKVMILDCCFSGAFISDNKGSKDDGTIDFQSELMGRGRVILTSSSSIETSQGTSESGLSLYTHHLINGIESGEADYDRDGNIRVEDLYNYVNHQLKDATPQMTPCILSEQEGSKIIVVHAPDHNPDSVYAREVTRLIQEGEISMRGQKSIYARHILKILQRRLRRFPEEVRSIEREVLKPYQHHYHNLQTYRKASRQLLRAKCLDDSTEDNSADRRHLLHLQQELGLRDGDVKQIEFEILASKGTQKRLQRTALAILGAGTIFCAISASILYSEIYARWNLPRSIVTNLDHWHKEFTEAEKQTRFQLAQQVLRDSDPLREALNLRDALNHASEAEQAIKQARSNRGKRDADQLWSKADQHLQTAISLLTNFPDDAKVTDYREYLITKKSQVESELKQVIAPSRKSKQYQGLKGRAATSAGSQRSTSKTRTP